MNTIEIKTNNQSQTLNLAKSIAKYFAKGDIIVLTGELGAGKTKFVEGFLQHFNLQDEISSPTFNIINEYVNSQISIYHFDVYRLENIEEFYAIGGEEYFEKGICLIEWGETLKDILPKEYISITIEKNPANENSRFFKVSNIGNSKRYENLLNIFQNEFKEESL